MKEGSPSDGTATGAASSPRQLRDRWFARLLRWPDSPTYANEVDAVNALWPPYEAQEAPDAATGDSTR
jgi:hypothetical protein